MSNAPGTELTIEVEFDTEPATVITIQTNSDSPLANIEDSYIQLNGSDWSSATASFTGCNGELITQEVPNPGYTKLFLELDYCEELNVYGCMDQCALNFNPDATAEDDSCIYTECENNTLYLYAFSYPVNSDVGVEYSLSFEGDSYSGTNINNYPNCPIPMCVDDGCGVLTITDLPGGTDNSYVLTLNSMYTSATIEAGHVNEGESVEISFGINDSCSTEILHYGCTDPNAENYNAWANVDNGICEYEEVENDLCQNASPLEEGTHLISNVGADSNEGIFGDCWAFGNGKGEQSSIWYTFTTPEEPAAITIEAITDGSNTFTDTQFGLFEECGGEMIYCDGNSGNGLMSKFEFACGELEPNTTYILLIDGYQGDNGTCYLEYSVDSPCEEPIECETNPAIVNIVTNTWSEEISWAILQDGELVAEGSGYEENNYQYTEDICLEDGCYTFEMYDSYGDGWNGGSFSIWLENGTFITSGSLESGEYGSVTFGVNAECEEEIEGCTDPEASNYNPEATVDDGSCEYSDCEANEILVQLNAGPGVSFEWLFQNSEEYLEEGGYSGLGAIEEYTFCVEDGCYNFTIYDFSENEWTGLVCIYVNGQTYLIESITNDSNLSFDIPVNSNCGEEIEGCTDPEALNYNPEATIDDGSCEYEETPCEANNVQVIIETDAWGGEISWAIYDDEQYTIAEGSGYENESSYTQNVCLEDGCYQFGLYDSFGDGWNGGSFTILLEDEVIANGTLENGDSGFVDFSINSEDCIIEGCTDPEAENYNPDATIDDGSCIYPADCSISFDLTADSLNLSTLFVIPSDSIGEAVAVLWDFGDGTTSTELFPDHEYEGDGPYNLCLTVYFEVGENDTCDVTFCVEITADMIPDLIPGNGGNSSGFFLNIVPNSSTIGIEEEDYFESIEIYPNPTSNFVLVEFENGFSRKTTITLYDVHGSLLKSQSVNSETEKSENKIDLSNYSSGLYFINVRSEVGARTFKVLKN